MRARLLQRFKFLVVGTAAWLAFGLAVARTEQAMTLTTPTGAIVGSLMLPAGAGERDGAGGKTGRAQVPVVLLIAGSGPTDRDGNSLGGQVHPDSLKLLAAALADAGFASLRYDKRGVGASARALAREDDIRFETYADDAAAWVAKLADDERFNGVAIVGHSEGSLIGMLAARQGRAAAFVSVAGPARNAADLLRTQLATRLPPGLVEPNESTLAALQQGEQVGNVPPALMVLYRPSVQPYLISWFRYEPAKVFAGLDVPCLILQGDSDSQVAVSEADALKAAKPSATLLVVPGMTHLLKLAPPEPGGPLATSLPLALPLAPGLIHGVVDFLSVTMKPMKPIKPIKPSDTTTP